MKRAAFVLFVFGVITLSCPLVQAVVVEFPLTEPFQYEREIGPVQIAHSSPVDIYVANVFDENRWKDWNIIIWVPLAHADLTHIMVDYDNSPDHTQPLEVFEVPMAVYAGPIYLGEEWKGFYANTWLAQWEQYGTNPVGSGLPHAWGNPAWVSFHFDVEVDPFIYIKDACIPEPTTICLLGLGALGLLRKRHA
jgi:hypothetical protein